MPIGEGHAIEVAVSRENATAAWARRGQEGHSGRRLALVWGWRGRLETGSGSWPPADVRSARALSVLLLAAACTARAPAPEKAASSASAAAGTPSVPAPPVPAVSRWELDPENSSVSFVCKHVLSNVRGMFHRPSGTLTIDESAPAKSQVKATIEVATITTGVEERDTHLKSADFFDAAQFPQISFASTSVSSAGGGAFSVTGDLSMHGVTKPVTLAVTVSPPFNHAGGIRRAIEASTSLNRRDFGLRWDFPGEGTGVVVGDTIKISIDAELVLVP